MTGLDTNVLVRYLTQDDPVQSERANQLIEQTLLEGKSLFINHIVLCELVWVLTRAYDYPKSDVVDVIEKILLAHQFEIEDKSSVWEALNDLKTSRADFADCLIGVKNRQAGCEKTWSFDQATNVLDSFTSLETVHLPNPKKPK
jgi:predicted nucleic-acid-binding protein